jgi:hypothetical protein
LDLDMPAFMVPVKIRLKGEYVDFMDAESYPADREVSFTVQPLLYDHFTKQSHVTASSLTEHFFIGSALFISFLSPLFQPFPPVERAALLVSKRQYANPIRINRVDHVVRKAQQGLSTSSLSDLLIGLRRCGDLRKRAFHLLQKRETQARRTPLVELSGLCEFTERLGMKSNELHEIAARAR